MKSRVKGSRLFKAWMKKESLSRRKAAKYLGVSTAVVQYWASGERRPNIVNAMRLEAITGVQAESWVR